MHSIHESVGPAADFNRDVLGRRAGASDRTGVQGYLTAVFNQGRRSEEVLAYGQPNVLANGGRDAFHTALYVNASATSVTAFNHVAVGTSATTPTISNSATTLANEVSGSGLARARGTGAHTDGTAVTEIAHTFTASAAVNNIYTSGLFNASSAGTLGHLAALTTSRNLAQHDTLTITWTLTLG